MRQSLLLPVLLREAEHLGDDPVEVLADRQSLETSDDRLDARGIVLGIVDLLRVLREERLGYLDVTALLFVLFLLGRRFLHLGRRRGLGGRRSRLGGRRSSGCRNLDQRRLLGGNDLADGDGGRGLGDRRLGLDLGLGLGCDLGRRCCLGRLCGCQVSSLASARLGDLTLPGRLLGAASGHLASVLLLLPGALLTLGRHVLRCGLLHDLSGDATADVTSKHVPRECPEVVLLLLLSSLWPIVGELPLHELEQPEVLDGLLERTRLLLRLECRLELGHDLEQVADRQRLALLWDEERGHVGEILDRVSVDLLRLERLDHHARVLAHGLEDDLDVRRPFVDRRRRREHRLRHLHLLLHRIETICHPLHEPLHRRIHRGRGRRLHAVHHHHHQHGVHAAALLVTAAHLLLDHVGHHRFHHLFGDGLRLRGLCIPCLAVLLVLKEVTEHL